MATTTTRGATLSLLCGAWIMNKSSKKKKKTKNPSSGAQHHQASIWHGNSIRKGRTLREMAWQKGMDEDAKEFPYICACYPYSSGIPECKERIIHREIVAFVAAWMRFQLDSCNLSSETDMAGAAAADAVAFPPGYLTLLPPVCCLLPAACAPVPRCVSFYATLFVCLLRVSLFYLDLCSVTGTRWYSENASQCGKFVSFSPRQIGWPTSSSSCSSDSSSASCRRQQLCRNLCAWIVGQLLLGHNSLAARISPAPSLPAYIALDSCAIRVRC